MKSFEKVLKNDERAIYSLRSLYKKYGYSLYKVSRFEEYDLYAKNKSFLVSRNILSFTDTNGKLLALKPDVTLSIIKNIADGDKTTHKFCYNETVYRTSADSDGFKEIMQTGLECIGEIDAYSQCEVVALAVESLDTISDDYIIDVTHMGLTEGILTACGIDETGNSEFLKLIECKNVHGLEALCDSYGVSEEMKKAICFMTGSYLPLCTALEKIKEFIKSDRMESAYAQLSEISKYATDCGFDDKIYFDFSIVNDMNYYDGVCFKGFVNGVPESVISGGRYDKLLRRLGKSTGAIGFAVYLDRLERLGGEDQEYDVDVILTYDGDVDTDKIASVRRELTEQGMSVLVGHAPDKSGRYRKLLKLTSKGVEVLENND